MATTKAISGNAVKNNGGTVMRAGNLDGRNVTKDLSIRTSLSQDTHTQVKNATTCGVQKAVSGGTFGYQAAGNYVGMKYTGMYVAGVASNALRSGAGDFGLGTRKAINALGGSRRYNITSWNYVTGAATTGGLAGAAFSWIDPNTAGGTTTGSDSAANPTRAIPGEFTYLVTGITPTNLDYSSKTGG